MGKHTNIWDWESPEARQKWIDEHDILKQPIHNEQKDPDKKELRARELQEQETIEDA